MELREAHSLLNLINKEVVNNGGKSSCETNIDFYQTKTKDSFTMKFCKNLQKVADISEPEWAPYWPNYKMLKVGIHKKERV